jgi:hypothetical protein
MTEKVKQATTNIAKIGFAAGLIYWMIRKGALDLDTVTKLASPTLLAFGIFFVFAQIFINNYRWLSLMRGQGFESTVGRTLPLSLIGMFFNYAMPGGVGGDVVKGYYLLQEYPRKKFAGAVSIFMDRLIGFFVMIGLAFLALFFNWSAVEHSPQLQGVAIGVSALFLGFLVFFFLSLSRVLQHHGIAKFLFHKLPGGEKLRHIYDALHSYRKAPGALISATILSTANIMLMVVFVWVIALTMGVNSIPFEVYCFLVPIGVVAQALPISPAGIGVGQAAFYFLFKLYLGKESAVGPTAITSMQILQFGAGLIGAYFYLQRKKPEMATELAKN